MLLFCSATDSVLNLLPLYSLTDGDVQSTTSAFGDDTPLGQTPKLGVATSNYQENSHHRRSQSEAGKYPKIQTQSHSHSSDPSHPYSVSESHFNNENNASTPPPHHPTIVPPGETTRLLADILVQRSGPWDYQVGDRELYMLLFSVLESVSSFKDSRGTSKISSTLRLLQSVTTLFEDTLNLWLQLHNSKESSGTHFGGHTGGRVAREGQNRRTHSADHISVDDGGGGGGGSSVGWGQSYSGSLQLARITLRLWVRLFSQILHSSLQDCHLAEVQPLLHLPLETISRACYNLQEAGVFRGNDSLDHEFTLVILEGLFSGLYVINLYPRVLVCQVSNLYEALRDVLTDGCQEWFAYLCSKLHGVSGDSTSGYAPRSGHTPFGDKAEQNGQPAKQQQEQTKDGGVKTALTTESKWDPVLRYSYSLLTYILAELLNTSSHIKTCQKAFKLVLASSGSSFKTPSSAFPFHRPITYSLEVATGFDKLTFRLSKMAELLLSMFKEVPRVQLLSLQLLSETTKDTIGVIGNFLPIIADPSIYTNSKVLDPYLELLEDVWFRLPPGYTGSAPWGKLSNYSFLLMEADHQVRVNIK